MSKLLDGLAQSGSRSFEDVCPAIQGLRTNQRTTIARSWERIATMEHASVAAFARFALQLLALGAPADLVIATQQAIGDEALHARLAFGLASAYRGAEVGPGLLDIDGALEDFSLEEITRLVVLEGCIGETIAALEAAQALELATDPAVKNVLARIVADETRHAELAWRFVQWALHTCRGPRRDALRRNVIDTIGRFVAAQPPLQAEAVLTDEEQVLAGHGVLPTSARQEVRYHALSEVILPCAEALTGKYSAEAA